MLDALLINAPLVLYTDDQDRKDNYFSIGDEYSFTPVNLLYLAAYLLSKDKTVDVMDITAYELTLEDIIKRVEKDQPKLIGLSATTSSIPTAVRIAKELRHFNIPIVLGGVHMTNDPTVIERFPYFDYGVVGDGEIVLHEILEGKHKKGIIYAPRIMDLDSLPFPAWHLVDPMKYKRKDMNADDVYHMDILTSRGCAYSCSFCSCPNHGNKVRFRKPKFIVDEMESKYDKCQGNFVINDDCFTISKRHILALAKEIKKRKMKCKMQAATRANNMDDEIMSALKEMGVHNIAIGCESGSERIRNEIIGKRITDKDLKNTVDLCRKYGIKATLFLMVGFPTETKEDLKKTAKIGPMLKADHIGVHQMTPYPGSRMWQISIDDGMIPADLIDQWIRGDRGNNFTKAWNYYVPKGFTQKDMIDWKRRIYLSFYFHPYWVIRKAWQSILHPMKFIKEDLQLFKILPSVIKYGGTNRQLN